jgi:large conductance mechanosensitive channel
MLKEFRQFILRGNLIDLAVAVVAGLAFNAVIQALIRDLITPIITAIAGKPSFSGLTFTIHHSVFNYGDFINYLIIFLLDMAALFFFVVKPLNALMGRLGMLPSDPQKKSCPECTSDIPEAARRCPQCTAVLVAS